MLLKQWAKEEKMMTHFCGKKEEKKNSFNIVISVDGKGTVFPAKLKIVAESFQ